MGAKPESGLEKYRLDPSKTVNQRVIENAAVAYTIDKNSFPALEGVTCYTLEVWEECMRLPHWHPNASELGFVVSGSIEVMLWRSPGESAVFTLSAGMCWFIPQGALHSLNNIGKSHAKLLVGFSNSIPQDVDLPVAFNGIPVEIRDAYVGSHNELRKWVGPNSNALVGPYHLQKNVREVRTASPYGFDFAKVTPLFNDATLGSVVWGVKSNWSILENISLLRACLKPGAARDAIWYPDVGTLYVVARGKGQFHIVIADEKTEPLDVVQGDYIFIPVGVLHTFINTASEEFEVLAFFTKANPLPEVSLSVATGFFPKTILKSAMMEYGTEHKSGDPLKGLQHTDVTPYLLKVSRK